MIATILWPGFGLWRKCVPVYRLVAASATIAPIAVSVVDCREAES